MIDYLERHRRHKNKHAAMVAARQSFVPHWLDLCDYILPMSGQFIPTDVNRGDKRMTKILDPTATFAAQTLSAGFMSTMTSPARRWHALTTPDPEMMKFQPVKLWLAQVDTLISDAFLQSNFYNVLPGLFEDLGVFGTAAMSILEDDVDIIRCHQYPIGSFCLAKNGREAIDGFTQEFSKTVRNLVEEYGLENCSDKVQALYRTDKTEEMIQVMQIIEPNPDARADQVHSKYKKWTSCVYEIGGDDGKTLSEKGYDEFPIMAPRWKVKNGSIYGTCPGMTALPHVKELQSMQRSKSQAVQKMLNPAMKGPTHMMGQRASTASGDITYVNEREGQAGFSPVFEVEPHVEELNGDIFDRRHGIRKCFHEDLFLMLAEMEKREMTTVEIYARQEEKITVLSPVIGQFNEGLLRPAVDRTFNALARRGKLPPAPRELMGMELQTKFISIMHQAQKLASLGSLDRVLGYAERIFPIYNEITDKIDLDQVLDEASDITGAPPKVVRPDDAVIEIRAQRAKINAAMQRTAQIEQASKAAKNLAQSPMDGDTALSRLAQPQNN